VILFTFEFSERSNIMSLCCFAGMVQAMERRSSSDYYALQPF
jgi:hypothetical protein